MADVAEDIDPPSDPEEKKRYEARRRDKQLQGALLKKSPEELFVLFDTDKSGFIDFDEFKVLLPQLGMNMSEAKAVRYFALVDEDGSGEIDLEEFRTTLYAMDPTNGNPLGFAPIDTLSPYDVFKLFDADGSGEIDEDEFADLLEYMKLDVADEKQEKLFQKYDVDGSGNISYDEFKKIWVKVCDVKKELKTRKIRFKALTPRPLLEKKLLACIDKEEDGEEESMAHARAFALERKRKARLIGMLKKCKRRAREELRSAMDACGQVYVFGNGVSRQFAAPCRDDAYVGFPRVKKLFEARVNPDKVIADERAADAAAALSTHVDEALLIEREIEGVDDAVGKNFVGVVCNANCAYLWGRRVMQCAIGESVIFARSDDGSVYCWGGHNDRGYSPTRVAAKRAEEEQAWQELRAKGRQAGATKEYRVEQKREARKARALLKRRHLRDGGVTPRSSLLLAGDRDDGRLETPRVRRPTDVSTSLSEISAARRANAESRAARRRGSRGSTSDAGDAAARRGSRDSTGSAGSAASGGSKTSLGSRGSRGSRLSALSGGLGKLGSVVGGLGRRGSAGSAASKNSAALSVIADRTAGSDGDSEEDDSELSDGLNDADAEGKIDANIIKEKEKEAGDTLKSILVYFDKFEPPPNAEARYDFFLKVLMPKVSYDDLALALDLRGKKFSSMNVTQLTQALGKVLRFEQQSGVNQRELFQIQSTVALHRDRNGPAYKPVLANKARKLFAEKWEPLIALERASLEREQRKAQMVHLKRVEKKEKKYNDLRDKITSARGHLTPVIQREQSMATKLSAGREVRGEGARIRFGGITARGPRSRVFRGSERVKDISAAGHHASLVHEIRCVAPPCGFCSSVSLSAWMPLSVSLSLSVSTAASRFCAPARCRPPARRERGEDDVLTLRPSRASPASSASPPVRLVHLH